MAAGRKGPKAVEKHAERANDEPAIVKTVERLAALVAEHGLTELIVETPEANVTLRRGASGASAVAAMPMHVPMSMPMPVAPPIAGGTPFTSHHAAAANPAAAGDDNAHIVKSPFVGTFYRRPNPDSENYVDLNDKVDKGQVLCIVEAMKLMNEIEADVAGTILGVLAEDGAPVEYGQPLFKIAPA
jgi:acetyl-CoA carboxylase biotin carboxyl carrier protein